MRNRRHETMVEMYRSGMEISEIAALLGCGEVTVYKVLKAQKVPLRTKLYGIAEEWATGKYKTYQELADRLGTTRQNVFYHVKRSQNE